MKTNDSKQKMWMEQWVKPGKEQTLEALIERFKDRILRVDHDRQEILISRTVEDIPWPR